MASVEECDVAITRLADRFSSGDAGRSSGLDRSVGATITDLDLRFRARLHDGVLDEIKRDDGAPPDDTPAQIRLTMTSDDLLALAAGELSLGSAWLAGRVKVHASFPDMLRLRSML